MPSFDAVNQINLQEVDNAVNNTKRELETRYDFRGTKTELDFDKKAKVIKVLTADTMKMDAIKDILIGKMVKRAVDPKCLTFGTAENAAAGIQVMNTTVPMTWTMMMPSAVSISRRP